MGSEMCIRDRSFLRAIRAVNNDYKAIIVVLDNFSTHVSNREKKEGEQLGMYLVYLPPYSPDLNPIEFIWKEEHTKDHLDCFRGECRSSEENNRKDIL